MHARIITPLIFALLLIPLTAFTGETPPAPPAPEAASPPETAPPPEAAPAPAPVHHRRKKARKRRRHAAASEAETTVEPASARLKVKTAGAPIYARASRHSEQIDTLGADKFVQVTGSTRSWLQVQLKDGRVGYVDPSSVYMVTPYDKQFLLTADAAVRTAPNEFADKVAEVHRGRYIHVVGQALNYLKIRMKDGTEGYVPMTAAQ